MKRFRCDWCNWTMGVDPSLATPMPYSLCSTSHSILQWHCFLDTRIHIKNSRWFRDRIAFLLMKTEYYYKFFFVDSHAILSTHRVHGTSAAWCFCGSIVQWYTGTGVSLPCPSPLKLLCCRCYLNFRRVRDLHVPCYWCEMLQGMGYPPRFWKTCFFFSDTRFVIRASYIPCLFQPLPRW